MSDKDLCVRINSYLPSFYTSPAVEKDFCHRLLLVFSSDPKYERN